VSDHPQPTSEPRHGWLYRRVVLPVLALLRLGATPERLAWSLAAGLMVGINPVLGSTTVLCLALAAVFRLNVAASQLTNHLVYPLELALLIPFLQAGSRLFGTPPMPLSAPELLHAARANPVALSRQLWTWEWHALSVWLLVAALATPMIALGLTPLLRRVLIRVRRHEYPLVPGI
jgi:uncharacterized protein (DUF2062 family)